MKEYWVGIDGTDSPWGGCTTWTLSNIIDRLELADEVIEFLDFPYLIRLNPNIPEKTRGNGALALYLRSSLSADRLLEIVKGQIIEDQANYQLNKDKSPGVVIASSKPSSKIYYEALVKYLVPDDLEVYLDDTLIWPDLNQSHIGALAAISTDLSDDYTFELLSYRKLENCGSNRIIEVNSIKEASEKYNLTFSSFDTEQSRELIAPSGPDPVFCGIRGEKPMELVEFFGSLDFNEELTSYTIFKTNQATNDHTSAFYKIDIEDLNNIFKPYQVYCGKIQLLENPREIQGGHVFANCRIGSKILEVSWFEPTKKLRDTARQLIRGDLIYVHGALMPRDGELQIQVEYMRIVNLKDDITIKSPYCDCGNRMTSAGSFAGYKCKNCGKTSKIPETTFRVRDIRINQEVYASKSAQRHLTRPYVRKYRRNTSKQTIPIEKDEFRKVI